MNNLDSMIKSLEKELAPYWASLEESCHCNFERILEGFLANGLSENHFYSVTGYGHNDMGRSVTDAIFAHAFQAEAALVRLQMVSGTHAIATALRGCLTPHKDTLISLTGKPYDTLEEVIGIRGSSRLSLRNQGIGYSEIDLLDQGKLRLDFSEEEKRALSLASVAFIQRSRGYSIRPSLTVNSIRMLIEAVRSINPGLTILVDNCYGEFVDTVEPVTVGADLVAGSLIKNPGGGIVVTGGYIAGRKDLVESAADALTAPGIGLEGGYTFDSTRTILQGLYFAPGVVKEALKGMSLASALFAELGYNVSPLPGEEQADIIQIIKLGDEKKVLDFCRLLQSTSPVDAMLLPVPAVTPGYRDPVVMAGGTFIFGSTIELSADAPLRPPYTLFLQGGLTYSHTRYVLKKIVKSMGVFPE